MALNLRAQVHQVFFWVFSSCHYLTSHVPSRAFSYTDELAIDVVLRPVLSSCNY